MPPTTPGTDRPLRIVVGTDGSDHGTRAVEWAAMEADRAGGRLEIHTAYWPGHEFATQEEITRSMENIVEEAAKRAADVAPSVPVTTHVHDRSPAAAMIEASEGADLLVVGSRGRGGFAGLVLGSVSHQCASHAHCPVTIVR